MLNPFKRFRVDRIFFSGFSLLIVMLLLAATWMTYVLTMRELMDNTANYQQDLLDKLNRQVEGKLLSLEQISLSVAGNQQLDDFLNSKSDDYSRFALGTVIENVLADTIYSMPIIQSIYLYMDHPVANKLGFVRYFPLEQAAGESWYQDVAGDQFAWIGEHTIQTDNGPARVISFVRKVLPPLLAYKGLLIINIKASELRNILIGEGGIDNGFVLYYRGKPIVSAGNAKLGDSVNQFILNVKHNTGQQHLGNILLVWTGISDSDWKLVEQTPWRSLSYWSLRLAGGTALTGITGILIALLMTLMISRQYIRPIKLLLNAMNQFSISGKEVQLPDDYRNEFGSLFAGFIRMRSRISELYRSLERQYARQKVVEVERLQAMINPHFLYNTLDQINWMALDAGQEDISHVLELMGRMFRIGLSDGESFIQISKEREYIESYLKIQNIRLKGKVLFELDIADSLLHTYIPKLTLQPFLENAVRHGFHGRQSGVVNIRGEEKDGGVLFTIADNGTGMPPRYKQPRLKTGGYGIRNVKERIAAYFGPRYGVDIVSKAGQGTSVIIFIPKIVRLEDWRVDDV